MPTTRVTLFWEDSEGHTMPVPVFFDTGDISTVALAQTAVDLFDSLFQAVSGSHLKGAEVCFGLNAIAGAPAAGSRNDAGAYLSFQNSVGSADGLYIPGFLTSKISNGVVSDADADVAALITEITGGGAADPLSTRNVAALWAAYRVGKQVVRKLKR